MCSDAGNIDLDPRDKMLHDCNLKEVCLTFTLCLWTLFLDYTGPRGKFNHLRRSSVQPYSMVVIGSESSIALGTLSLSGLVSRLDTVEAEDMKALCEDHVFATFLTAWTCQLFLRKNGEDDYNNNNNILICLVYPG